jgi:hypothetical protein
MKKILFDKHPLFSGNLWNWKEYLIILTFFSLVVTVFAMISVHNQKKHMDYLKTRDCVHFVENTMRTDDSGKVLHTESMSGYQCQNGMVYWNNGHYTNWK